MLEAENQVMAQRVARVAALEAENKEMSQKLSASEEKEQQMMATIVRQQNAFMSLQKQFDALKGSRGSVVVLSNGNKQDTEDGQRDDDEKSSKWSLFGGKRSRGSTSKGMVAEPKEIDAAKTPPVTPPLPAR